MIPRDRCARRTACAALLQEVRSEPRGPQLFMSRTAPDFLIELFKLEVPEVGQGLIEINGAARDPGRRAKIAVQSQGQAHRPGRRLRRHARFARAGGVERARRRARRHHAVGREPGAVRDQRDGAGRSESIVVDEEAHSMDIAVAEDKLAQAIGRGGQNVRLATD